MKIIYGGQLECCLPHIDIKHIKFDYIMLHKTTRLQQEQTFTHAVDILFKEECNQFNTKTNSISWKLDNAFKLQNTNIWSVSYQALSVN